MHFIMLVPNYTLRVFTFTHLKDAFIQINLHCTDVLGPNFDGNRPIVLALG